MIGKWCGKWRVWLCAALIGFSWSAHSNFHLWQITEVYSNASGTVQFIELTALSGGQQFLAGHTITGAGNFTFPSNLPSDTAGRKFLVGTSGFAALNVVAPDYIVPNNFLALPNGMINFANVNVVNYTNLPADGVLSIDQSGATATNSPTNFAGVSGTISPPANTVPAAPTIGIATAGNGQASVAFTPPANNGGSTITSFTAFCGTQNTSGPSSPIVVTGLTAGVSVSCTVSATNGVGTGPQSGASNSVTPLGVPDAPGIGAAVAGNMQVTVNFQPPVNNGGSAITGYTASCGGQNAGGGGTPLTVAGLANGIPVTCSVIATNAQGSSNPSAPSNSVTPATVPGAPTIGTATAGNAQVTVNFSPPASDGGAAIFSYTATCGGQNSSGSASPVTVFGLTNGAAVTCTVIATNIQGNSISSTASNSVTPATVPGAPTIGTATPGNMQVSVTFLPPGSNGGSAITGYTATCGTQNASAGGSPITVLGLANGVPVTCRVVANNALGSSVASSASNSVTPATVPGAPAIGNAVPGNGEAFIAFTPPASNGGTVITGYTATCNPGALPGSGTVSPITVGGLMNTTMYVCQVTATNAIGPSVASATVNVTPELLPALTPIAVRSRKTHTGVGPFDLPIETGVAIGGQVSVEPRTIGAAHTIVFLFNKPVAAPGTVSAIDTSMASIGMVSAIASGREVIVTLAGVPDNQRVTVSLTGVDGTGVNVDASMGFLVGDVSNSRSVNAGDILGVKARLGQAIGSTNFRFDLNTTGVINASDVSVVKSRSGVVLP